MKLALSETPKTGFVATRPKYVPFVFLYRTLMPRNMIIGQKMKNLCTETFSSMSWRVTLTLIHIRIILVTYYLVIVDQAICTSGKCTDSCVLEKDFLFDLGL